MGVQIGPSVGVDSGDHMWMSRYSIRVCAEQCENAPVDPKPIPGDWNGASGHTNPSTAVMRAPGGYAEIIKAIVSDMNSQGEGKKAGDVEVF